LFARPFFLAAFLAAFVAVLLLSVPAAQAFTFEDGGDSSGGGAKNNDSSMFYNDGKNAKSDPLTSRLDSGNTTAIKRGNGTIYFGGGQSFDQRNNPDSYFNPNVLMGR
jgi:hypothetical protein